MNLIAIQSILELSFIWNDLRFKISSRAVTENYLTNDIPSFYVYPKISYFLVMVLRKHELNVKGGKDKQLFGGFFREMKEFFF